MPKSNVLKIVEMINHSETTGHFLRDVALALETVRHEYDRHNAGSAGLETLAEKLAEMADEQVAIEIEEREAIQNV
jgi:hypothetical protein